MSTAPAPVTPITPATSTEPRPGGAIFALIPKLIAEIGHIGKTRENKQQHYSFRGIDDVYKAVQPVFARHGVFCAPEVLNCHREERQAKGGGALTFTLLTVRHRFYATDGSFVDVVTVGEGMDSSDKSANKAMSGAYKYAVFELFAVPTEGAAVDSEDDHPEPKSREEMLVEEIEREMRAIARRPGATVGDLRTISARAKGVGREARDYLLGVYQECFRAIGAAQRQPGQEG